MTGTIFDIQRISIGGLSIPTARYDAVQDILTVFCAEIFPRCKDEDDFIFIIVGMIEHELIHAQICVSLGKKYWLRDVTIDEVLNDERIVYIMQGFEMTDSLRDQHIRSFGQTAMQ